MVWAYNGDKEGKGQTILGKVSEITKIHYNGLMEEFKAVGIEANIDYLHLKRKCKDTYSRWEDIRVYHYRQRTYGLC